MDAAGEAISKTLVYLTKAQSPQEAYRKSGSLLRCVGGGGRLASESEIISVVLQYFGLANIAGNASAEEITEYVTSNSIDDLQRQDFCCDEEQVRQAVKLVVESRGQHMTKERLLQRWQQGLIEREPRAGSVGPP